MENTETTPETKPALLGDVELQQLGLTILSQLQEQSERFTAAVELIAKSTQRYAVAAERLAAAAEKRS